MTKPFRAAEQCPKCGSHLIIRSGEYGEFLACPRFPQCKYTQSLFGITEVKEYQPPSPYCEKCGHTGKIPFINQDGKVIANCWAYCECHQDGPEYPYRLTPDLFDYPMSYSHYRGLCQLHGWLDPGSDEPAPAPPGPAPQVVESQWTARQWNTVQQSRAEITHLSNKINDHIDKSRRRQKGKY